MKKKNFVQEILAMAGIFFLILDGKSAFLAAEEGISLCIHTVIPRLLPFFFLTGLLNGTLSSEKRPFLSRICRFMGLPENASGLLIGGFLGGYPMGAKMIGDQYRLGQLGKQEARRLLYFCSNAGPAFFFGILSPLFEDLSKVLILYGIHVCSALLIGLLLPPPGKAAFRETPVKVTPADAMESAVKAAAVVCGWIICFRILSSAAGRWILWRLPKWAEIFCSGLLELTGGCTRLNELTTWQSRFLMASALSGFGGLAVTMQTFSVLGDLPGGTYLQGKLLHAFISLILAFLYIRGIYPGMIAIFLLTILLKGKLQKSSRKSILIGV